MVYFKFLFYLFLFISTNITFAQYKYGANLHKESIQAINSKNNNLYVGIDNYLKIDTQYLSNINKLWLTTNNGIIIRDEDSYNTIPIRSGKSRIIAYNVENNDTSLIGHIYFEVQNLPEPKLLLDSNIVHYRDTIRKKIFLLCDSLKIFISNDIIGSDNWYKVKSFSVGYTFGGMYISHKNDSNFITDKTKILIAQLGPGKILTIRITVINEGLIIKKLPIYRLVIY